MKCSVPSVAAPNETGNKEVVLPRQQGFFNLHNLQHGLQRPFESKGHSLL